MECPHGQDERADQRQVPLHGEVGPANWRRKTTNAAIEAGKPGHDGGVYARREWVMYVE